MSDDESQSSTSSPTANRKRKKSSKSSSKTKKKAKESFIDDSAILSGSDNSSDDEEEDDDVNEYVSDDFIVDDDDAEKGDDLEDSASSADDSDADDHHHRRKAAGSSKRKTQRIRKKNWDQELDDDDLDLIEEAQGGASASRRREEKRRLKEERLRKISARNEAELRENLFDPSDDESDGGGGRSAKPTKSKKQHRRDDRRKQTADLFDEDALDDFIDDDLGDQDELTRDDRGRGAGRGRGRDRTSASYDDYDRNRSGDVFENQIAEAEEIFGDFMPFMEDADDGDGEAARRRRYKEKGVGVDLGVGSGEEVDDASSDSSSLFESDASDASQKKARRAAARASKKSSRKSRLAERRKKMLLHAFEPVQLAEHFCTERDDKIRMKDVPERYFDWNVPFCDENQEDQATWIVSQIPPIAAEFFSGNGEERRGVLVSIQEALRYFHKDKLEPEFVRRYRADIVTSAAVRDNLYSVFDKDGEWEKMMVAKKKVGGVLEKVVTVVEEEEVKAKGEEEVESLEKDLKVAQEKLDEAVRQETKAKDEMEALSNKKKKPTDGETKEGDNDDELFGKDDNDASDDDETKQERTRLKEHLDTIHDLVQERAERVASLSTRIKSLPASSSTTTTTSTSQLIRRKMCPPVLLAEMEYRNLLNSLTDDRNIRDISTYLSLINEGNEAILSKLSSSSLTTRRAKRSRRFDRDYYRTCVTEGLRSVAYKFVLGPVRAGVKLEGTILENSFDYNKMLAGEDEDDLEAGDPARWMPPVVESDPEAFANDLVGSGELVLLNNGPMEVKDPLKGCRYVAAIELANEPRVKRYMRDIYRENVLLTTQPTEKGLETIDYFHEYFGLHLVRGKPIKDHFSDFEKDAPRFEGLTPEERKDAEEERFRREQDSCLQYLKMMKAERTGDIKIKIHLPYKTPPYGSLTPDERSALDRWYSAPSHPQDLTPLLAPLSRIYLSSDPPSSPWNVQRTKILEFAIRHILLPLFESETRRQLRTAAINHGIRTAARHLRQRALEGPYRPHHLSGDNRFLTPTGDGPIVGVCIPVVEREATFLVAANGRGEAVDHMAVPAGCRIDERDVPDKLQGFLIKNRPCAVVVGVSGGLPSRHLARRLGDEIHKAMEAWNNRDIQNQDEDDEEFEGRRMRMRKLANANHLDEDEDTWRCNVDLVDDNVAQLFGRSVRGKREFSDKPMGYKVAIALARHAQNPLGELCYAWSVASDAGFFGSEMLFLNVSPLQRLLPKMTLLKEYERVLCGAVSDVGVDVNAACSLKHLHGLLQFVPGLGARKAASLRQSVGVGGSITSRRDLLVKRFMGPTVYNNAVAFLRIRDKDNLLGYPGLHPLDDTRLHPDVYHRNTWAVKIAIDAMEPEQPENNEEFQIRAIKDAMDNSQDQVRKLFEMTKAEWEGLYGPTFDVPAWDPQKNVPADQWRDNVEELDLETFAKMIENDGMGKWLSHLLMIKWEFRLPFEDPRKPMEPLSGDRLFSLLTGESDETLRPGKEITGKIIRNGDYGSKVKLEGDIPGFIPKRNFPHDALDRHYDNNRNNHNNNQQNGNPNSITVGNWIRALVTAVKKDHICVDLTMKPEDFKRPLSDWERPKSLFKIDACFDFKAAKRIESDRKIKIDAFRKTHGRIDNNVASNDAPGIGNDGKSAAGRVSRRACAHPAFRNAKHNEVDKELMEGGEAMVGEALVRPSSRDGDSLAVHWVVRPKVVKVIEVREEDKEANTSIGNKLKIKNEVYESIDELLGRYIAPMNERVDEVSHHRKFKDMLEDDLDAELRNLKKAHPNQIFYFVCWNEQYPPYVSLRFIIGQTPRNHNIGLTPEGFVWGNALFPNLDRLINEFKKNPRGPGGLPPGGSSSSSHRPPPQTKNKPSRWGDKQQQDQPKTSNKGWSTNNNNPPPPSSQSKWGAGSSSSRPPPPAWNNNRPPPPPPGASQPPPPTGLPPPPPAFGFPPSVPPGPPPMMGMVPPTGMPPGMKQQQNQGFGSRQ